MQRQGAQAEQLIQVLPLYQHSCASASCSDQHKAKICINGQKKKMMNVIVTRLIQTQQWAVTLQKALNPPSAYECTTATAVGGTDEHQDESSQMKTSERRGEIKP